MIVFDPFWETMKQKGISTYTPINKYNISSSTTIHRLRHNLGVTTQLLDNLCRIFDCEDIWMWKWRI